MPKRHAQEGENLSPPLRWEDAPEETKSFALIVEDPDAPSGTCRHWAIYNIDAGANSLPENSRRPATTPGAPDTTDQSLLKVTGRTTIIFA